MQRSNLLSYYVFKGFVILEQAFKSLNNVPLRVQNNIYAIHMFDSDYIVSCSTAIPSVANTPKKIYLGGALCDELTSE